MLLIYLSMIESKEDTDKFIEIYNKYKTMMYQVAFSILKKAEDAEDAVQEAFFKLAKNISKVDEVSCKKTEAFLVIISRSTAIDILRKNRREHERIDIDEENDMDSLESNITTNILEEIISGEGYNNLIKLINELGNTYKDTLKLRFIFEWTNGEIADLLGISKNTVEFRISHGRALLIKALEKEGYYADRKQKSTK